MYKVLDLFSGIGGFSLGLEWTKGFETVAFCEIDERARRVLSKHWPHTKQYTDIKELTYEKMQADGIEPTVITGGFPCQDISTAGRQEGIIGERSSLWSEYARLIKDVRPTWAIIENVSALRSKGLTLVLQNLNEIGYNAEWHCIPCSAVGGLHRRDRIWIIAYPMANANRFRTLSRREEIQKENGEISEWNNHAKFSNTSEGTKETSEEYVVNSNGIRCQHDKESKKTSSWRRSETSTSTTSSTVAEKIINREQLELFAQYAKNFWSVEPNVGRVANGIPNRVHRLKQLGNSVVPQIPQFLGECILNYDESRND